MSTSRAPQEDNLSLWHQISKTDPSAVKKITEGTLAGRSSINVQQTVKQMTEAFGPVGKGWGYAVVSERIDEGAPIYTRPKEGSGEKPEYICHEKIHTLCISVWVRDAETGAPLHASHYGATRMVYGSKWGTTTDEDYAKKSLSDALKKAASIFGCHADIFLGEWDDPSYVAERKAEEAIEKAEDKEAAAEVQRQEYEGWKGRNLELIASATQLSELEGLFNAGARKAARRDDSDYLVAMGKRWRERIPGLIGRASDRPAVEAIYAAAKARSKSWGERGLSWLEGVKELCSKRTEALESSDAGAAE